MIALLAAAKPRFALNVTICCALLVLLNSAAPAGPLVQLPPATSLDSALERDILSTLDEGGGSQGGPLAGTMVPDTRLEGRPGAESLSAVDAWLRTGDFDRALTAAQQVLESFPGSGLAYEVIGTVRFLQQDDAAAIAAFSRAVQVEPAEPALWNKLGTAYLRAGQLEPGREALTKAVELDPDDRFSHQKLGILADQSGDIAAAIHHYRMGLEGMDPRILGVAPDLAALLNAVGRFGEAIEVLEPRLPPSLPAVEAQHTLATALLGAGKPDQAALRFQAALSYRPGFQPSMLGLAIASRQRGNLELALNLVDQLLAERPDWALAATERGRILIAARRYDEALAAIDRAESLGEEINLIARLRSGALLANGDRSAAEGSLMSVIEAGKASPTVYATVSEYRIGAQDFSGALAILRDAVEKHPASAYAWFRLGSLQAAMRQYPAAIDSLDKALQFAPNDPAVSNALVMAYARNGDGGKALSLAEQLHARYPQDQRIALTLASRLEAEGQRERAIATYRQINRNNPNVPLARNNLASLLTESGQLREAEIHAARAADLAPGNAQILETHGNVLYQLGRYREALDQLQRAAALAPNNGLIAYRTALTLGAMGQAAPASEMAAQAIRLDPDAPWVQDARRFVRH